MMDNERQSGQQPDQQNQPRKEKDSDPELKDQQTNNGAK